MAKNSFIEQKSFIAGDVIFREDEQGRTAYIVQEGGVDIYCTLPGGGEKVLANVGRGAIFGEMALIDDKARMATARATEPTTVIVVTEHMFQHKLDQADPFIRGLMNIMADTIRAMGKA